MSRDDRSMRRMVNAGRRLAACDHERLAALDELTAACRDLPDASAEDLARTARLPVLAVIAARVRLEQGPRALRRTG